MTPLETLITSLKSGIRFEGRHWLDHLLDDPLFQEVPADKLEWILEEAIYFQDQELLQRFVLHPNFAAISEKGLGRALLAAIRLVDQVSISEMREHRHLNRLSPETIEQVSLAALDSLERYEVERLMRLPVFKDAFKRHFEDMVQCAIRNRDVDWIKDLIEETGYAQVDASTFQPLLRWALRNRERDLIAAAIAHHHFDAKTEAVVRQEFADAFIEEESKVKQSLEAYLGEQLLQHPEYTQLSPLLVAWMIEKAIDRSERPLVDKLILHPHYPAMTGAALAPLLLGALEKKDAGLVKILTEHPHFSLIPGGELGLVLEQAVFTGAERTVELLINHPHFVDIPEDSFKHIVAMEIENVHQELKRKCYRNPIFKKRIGEMIYETIRRNEIGLIDALLRDPLIKEQVVDELVQYATTDSLFVSKYVIRDVIREVFVTKDHGLVKRVLELPLFQQRVDELMEQSIAFDDAELIESLLIDKRLRPLFQTVMQRTRPEDRQRIAQLLIDNAQIAKADLEVMEIVRSWKAG